MSLKEMRTRMGYTQAYLAEISGVSLKMIRLYEQGARDINGAKFYTLLVLSETLSCNLEDLLTDEDTLELWEVYRENREAD